VLLADRWAWASRALARSRAALGQAEVVTIASKDSPQRSAQPNPVDGADGHEATVTNLARVPHVRSVGV
jgi:hypothetical protein